MHHATSAGQHEGTVGSRRAALILLLVGALLATLLPASNPQAAFGQDAVDFTDISERNFHYGNIITLAEAGIIAGFPDGTFRPGLSITRGQMASLLARAEGLEPAGPPYDFTDIEGTTHAGNIQALADIGVIEGRPDGTFGPGLAIRRDQMASLVGRWLEVDEVDDGPFTDVPAANVHLGNINALAELGVMVGVTTTTFRPAANLRRDQTASVVARSLDLFDAVEITMVAINDFHGRLLPPSGALGGAAYLATHLDNVRAEKPNTLFVDAGDLVGATPVLSNLFYDEPTIEAANIMGLDIQTVGNHEFDRGQDEVLRRAEGGCLSGDCSYRGDLPFEGSDFVTLSTNVIVDATGEALTYPYDIIEVDGIAIGFIGVTTVNTPNVVSPTGIQGLTFLPEAEAVNATVPDVLADGADVIVVLMHEGARQDVANPDPNACENRTGAAAQIVPQFHPAVDVVIEGHTHQSYVCDLEDGPLVTQAFEYGKRFTEIDLLVGAWTGRILDRSAVNRDVTRDVDPDPEMEALIAEYQTLAGPALQEVVGTSTVAIPRTTRSAESAQGNLATDALIDQYGVDFAFQNSGGLRADLTVDADRDGDLYNIRREYVLAVWPFGNIVALAEVEGPMLKAILDNGVREVGGGRFIQVAGLRIDYSIDESVDPADNNGFPRGVIENVEYWNHPDFADGTPVDLSEGASHTIALNDFMSVGGDSYPVLGDRVFSLQDPLEIAVERYLQTSSPVTPVVEGRIVQLD